MKMMILALIFTSNVFANEYQVPIVDFPNSRPQIKNVYLGEWDSDFNSLITESVIPQRDLASSSKIEDAYQEKINYWKIESIIEKNDKY
ncbi:MAG: hypothetical protein HOJ35_09580 [Bdellovibrionales bacterium]|jgi:hypothetical protein|nr:hypothetical protein [Bdellovibrionales bacterium]